VALHRFKKDKHWILKVVDRRPRKTVVRVPGSRDMETCQRLYDQVQYLTSYTCYPDDGEALAAVLPTERPVIGKVGTIAIEQEKSHTRHHRGRMTRRTQVVAKTECMVHVSIKRWLALTTP
jgi:IS1 family transposase